MSIAVGVTAVILFGSAAVWRRRSPDRPPPREAASDARRQSRPGLPPASAARGSEDPREGARPTPEGGGDDPEVERLFRQYRVALSKQDRAVEDALYPVLLARREAALAAARREAAAASSPEERQWAERAIRFLSDPPGPPTTRRPRREP